MSMQRPKLIAVLLGVATAFAAETTYAQATRSDPTAPATRAPSSTAPSASKGMNDNRASPAGKATTNESGTSRGSAPGATTPRGDALGPGTGAGTMGGGVPAIGGVTPNRAELAGSAFAKLDSGNKGYVTLDDVRQLDGFDAAFRQSDQNGDGRLNASEFNSAWGAFTGNVR